MFLKSRDGIICDICGKSQKNKFTYYSYSCTRINVDKDRAATEVTKIENDILDFDICSECHKLHVDTMLGISKKQQEENA